MDESRPPLPFGHVLGPVFLLCLAGFLCLIFAGATLDAALSRGRWPDGAARLWSRWIEPETRPRRRMLEAALIRLGVGGYCLSLWDEMAVVPWGAGQRAIITPELLLAPHAPGAVALLQAATALLTLSRRTCPLAGVGLLGLFAVGIARAGVFHMTDYVYFLGLAWYLLTSCARRPALLASRLPALAASLSFALMWTAVEKFLYPQWTGLVLLAHPEIAAGVPPAVVTTIAGFVEFSLAFYLLVGGALLRLDALALMLVFVAAVPSFGRLDAAGHLPIVAILAAICLHGPTPLQVRLRNGGARYRHVPPGARVCGGFGLALVVVTAGYYGLQLSAG